MKRALGLAIILLFTTSISDASALTPANAFRDACHLSRYHCGFLRAPMVRYSYFIDLAGALGIYMGGRTIWMSPEVSDDKKRYIVMVHEMVHYLQTYIDENGVPLTSKFERCVYEEEAFEVSDKVAKRLDEPTMIRPGILITSYGCS